MLMNMDTLTVLAKLYPSLSTMPKLSSVVDLWPYMGEGAFKCSLNLSPNVLVDFNMYSSLQSHLLHLQQYIIPIFCCNWSLSFSDTRMFLSVLLPLKYVWKPYLPQMFLILSHRPCIYVDQCTLLDLFDGPVVVGSVAGVVVRLVLLEGLKLNSIQSLCGAFKLGYDLRCSSLVLSSSGVEQTATAPCTSLLIALYFLKTI